MWVQILLIILVLIANNTLNLDGGASHTFFITQIMRFSNPHLEQLQPDLQVHVIFPYLNGLYKTFSRNYLLDFYYKPST